MNTITAEEAIRLLELVPLPGEGGFFRETYRSTQKVIPELPIAAQHSRSQYRSPEMRSASTAIYFLLTSENSSRPHRIPVDEVFHFYFGASVEMLILSPEGEVSVRRLGTDILGMEQPQIIVPGGCWQAARVMQPNTFALLGTTVAPGFEFSDLEFPDADTLLQSYTHAAELLRPFLP